MAHRGRLLYCLVGLAHEVGAALAAAVIERSLERVDVQPLAIEVTVQQVVRGAGTYRYVAGKYGIAWSFRLKFAGAIEAHAAREQLTIAID